MRGIVYFPGAPKKIKRSPASTSVVYHFRTAFTGMYATAQPMKIVFFFVSWEKRSSPQSTLKRERKVLFAKRALSRTSLARGRERERRFVRPRRKRIRYLLSGDDARAPALDKLGGAPMQSVCTLCSRVLASGHGRRRRQSRYVGARRKWPHRAIAALIEKASASDERHIFRPLPTDNHNGTVMVAKTWRSTAYTIIRRGRMRALVRYLFFLALHAPSDDALPRVDERG